MPEKFMPTGLRTSDIIHMLNKEESKRYYDLSSRQQQREELSKEEQEELRLLTEKHDECARKNIENDGECTEGELI